MNVLPNQKIQTNRGDIKTHNSKDGSLKKEGSLESNNLFDMTGELHEIVTQEIEQNKSETAVRHRKDTKKYNHAITAQQEINQQKNVSSNLRQQINHQVDEIYQRLRNRDRGHSLTQESVMIGLCIFLTALILFVYSCVVS